jgi:hypothetical protein
MSIGIRSAGWLSFLSLLAASVACGSSGAEPTGSSVQAVDTSCPPFTIAQSGDDGGSSCVLEMMPPLPVGVDAAESCPGPAVPPPAGMESCTMGLAVTFERGSSTPVTATLWLCPDSLEGSLPNGIGVGMGGTNKPRKPFRSACLGEPASGYFFAYSLAVCDPRHPNGCTPDTGCVGNCIFVLAD